MDVKIEVLYEGETFWLNQRQIAELFGIDLRTVNYHPKEIYGPSQARFLASSLLKKNGEGADSEQQLSILLFVLVYVHLRYFRVCPPSDRRHQSRVGYLKYRTAHRTNGDKTKRGLLSIRSIMKSF